MSLLEIFILACVICCGGMTITWLVARHINNYSIVDAVWCVLFFVVTAVAAALSNGRSTRQTLLLLVVGIWSLRLTWFLTRRIASHHPTEDGRYIELRKKYAPNVARGFFSFFQMQALSVAVLAVPFFMIARNSLAELATIELVGVVVALLAILGEATSDAQMNRFKRDLANRGKPCEIGFWRFSRHPNYFFESCAWLGFYLFSLGSPYGFLTIYCPLTILYLLLKVTGVPLSEAQSLKSRGDAYRAYQRRTSIFVPWFPKKTD